MISHLSGASPRKKKEAKQPEDDEPFNKTANLDPTSRLFTMGDSSKAI